MNKTKMIVALCACVVAGAVLAAPRGARPGGRHGGGHRPAPIVHHGGVHHHHGWGRGGRGFWPGFVGGIVGGVIGNSFCDVVVTTPVVSTPVVVSTPPVVTQPVVVQPTKVWVEGCYVNQVQANGTVLRVWQPGHYEIR